MTWKSQRTAQNLRLANKHTVAPLLLVLLVEWSKPLNHEFSALILDISHLRGTTSPRTTINYVMLISNSFSSAVLRNDSSPTVLYAMDFAYVHVTASVTLVLLFSHKVNRETCLLLSAFPHSFVKGTDHRVTHSLTLPRYSQSMTHSLYLLSQDPE